MPVSMKPRKRARFHAIQALYQRELAQTDYIDLRTQFYEDNLNRHSVDWEFFHDLITGVQTHQDQLDDLIRPLVDRDFAAINPVELAVLRLGAYELTHRIEIPYQVIVNEYVEQAKSLGATDGHKFVNGLLDKLAHKVRSSLPQ